jgi:hypothetical protein
MEQPVQRMIQGLFFATFIGVSVKMDRQSGDCFSENANTRIYRCHLHGRSLGYRFAGTGTASEECIRTTDRAVLRLISGTE